MDNKHFEQWFTRTNPEREALLARDITGYKDSTVRTLSQGYNGAQWQAEQVAITRKEKMQENFEKWWATKYEWELKRGSNNPRSLRQVKGEYVAKLTHEAWGVWQGAYM